MQGQPGLSMAVRAADEAAPRADVHALVVAHAPMGIAAIDADGIYRSVNPAYCALYGWRAETALARPRQADALIVPA